MRKANKEGRDGRREGGRERGWYLKKQHVMLISGLYML